MKSYTDYMDNISVDKELHERIMERVTQKSTPQHRPRAVFRYAGLAACAAVLLLCVWTIPGLFNAPVDNIANNPGEINEGDINIIESGDPQNGAQVGTIVDDPTDPNSQTRPLYALTFNVGASIMQADAQWAFGCFDYDLNDEQLNAVFPGLNLIFAANAFYGVDGTLLSVTAIESMIPGRMEYPAMYMDAYKRTEIKLGEGQIIEDCVVMYDDTPQISDVFGVPVAAYIIDFNRNNVVFFQAEFTLENIAYRISLYDNITDGQKRMTEIVNTIIYNGAADLTVLANPVIPELRHDSLTLNEARLDPDFGLFIPSSVPNGFVFESSYRVIDQRQNNLFVHWGKQNSYIEILVSEPTEFDREHIVSVSEREKYDMTLYTIPLADSVPGELWDYVDHPVFLADEFSLEVIQARAYWVDTDRGDVPAWRMSFSVLYGDNLVRISVKGATSEQVWEMLAGLNP